MKLAGGLLQLGYRLQRHRFWALPLGYWPLGLGLMGSVISFGTRLWLCTLALAAVGLLLLLVMVNARRQRYVRFAPDESLAAHLPPDVPVVRPDEKLPVRVTGFLEVRDARQYFVEAAADLATMETREHIVMARIPLSRMWLVARSPAGEVGWWYAFIQPVYIRSIQVGWLHHGLRRRPALRLLYQRRRLIEGKEIVTQDTLFLSAANRLTLHRLLENLVRDAGRPVDAQQYVPL